MFYNVKSILKGAGAAGGVVHPQLPVGTMPAGAPRHHGMAKSNFGHQEGTHHPEHHVRTGSPGAPITPPAPGTPLGPPLANVPRPHGMTATGPASKPTQRRHFQTNSPPASQRSNRRRGVAPLTHNASLEICRQLIHLLMMPGHFYLQRIVFSSPSRWLRISPALLASAGPGLLCLLPKKQLLCAEKWKKKKTQTPPFNQPLLSL